MLRCRFSMILAAVVLASGIATAQDAAEWPNTGRDLYTQCASPNRALAHACAEFLLGLMYGAIGTLSSKIRSFARRKNCRSSRWRRFTLLGQRSIPSFWITKRLGPLVRRCRQRFPARNSRGASGTPISARWPNLKSEWPN